MDAFNRGTPPADPQGNCYLPNYLPSMPPEGYQNGLYQPGEGALGMPMGGQGYDMMFPEGLPMGQQPELQSPQLPRPMQAPYPGTQPAPPKDAEQVKEPSKTKPKRRSKNDVNGRDFRCGCGKTYLSYPALYTHIKTKHNGQSPPGTPMFQSSRGRGRPRKVGLD